MSQVPTDWQFFLFYYVMYLDVFSSKRILVKTWVEELDASDEQNIENMWQPTSARYISPEERAKIEEEERIRVEKELEDRLN